MQHFTYIKQDRFVIKDKDGKMVQRGNCLQATLASLMGLQLRDVPDFSCFFDCKTIHWNVLMDQWLEEMGWEMVDAPEFKTLHGIKLNAADLSWLEGNEWRLKPNSMSGMLYEVCGKSPRGDFNHSAIYMGYSLFHDPHPSNDGCEPHNEQWPWSTRRLIKL